MSGGFVDQAAKCLLWGIESMHGAVRILSRSWLASRKPAQLTRIMGCRVQRADPPGREVAQGSRPGRSSTCRLVERLSASYMLRPSIFCTTAPSVVLSLSASPPGGFHEVRFSSALRYACAATECLTT